MSQTDPSIFLDNTNTPWQLGPGWVRYSELQFMGGSTEWARETSNASISLEFTGIQISYFGNAVGGGPWNFTTSIDGGSSELHTRTQEEGVDQLAYDWYASPELEEGNHKLDLFSAPGGLAIDYTIIKPSRSQNVRNNVLIVDDGDALMKYSGSWKQVGDRYALLGTRAMMPYGGGTHVGNRVGDLLQFPFTGSSVQVYGFYEWKVSGSLTLSFGIDEWPTEEVVYPRNASDQGQYEVQPNFLFYETSTPAGNHVLTINVTNIVGGQRAIIDAIHYTASFDRLDAMPHIDIPGPPSSAVSSVTPSATTTLPPSSPSNGTKSSAQTGAIIGGVVGGVCVLAVISALVWMSIRRRRRPLAPSAEPWTGKTSPDLVGITSTPFIPPATSLASQSGPTQMSWSDGNTSSIVMALPRKGGASTPSGEPDTPPARDDRVSALERQVQQLTRQTEELQYATQNPPPY